jgi:two-component system, OmpR family, phosphate regulon sensor histidine kinase PhoR
VVNDTPAERASQLVGTLEEPVVVLDSERRLVAASAPAAELLGDLAAGRRLNEETLSAAPGVLVLFLDAAPELSAYQELRAGFTAAVSHELRTPLARMLVLLETATLPEADVDELVEQARQEVHQARELIDDVLFLGELETGREVVTLGPTLAAPIVAEVVEQFAARAERAQVELVVEADPELELPLRPRMLRVVLENLVTNSIRYAGPGARCVVTVADAPGGGMLGVADNGKGVSASDVPRLFERFYRADQARSSRGTGLGLAIVKHVVTAAGGTVEARSEPGQGVEIVARFPLV